MIALVPLTQYLEATDADVVRLSFEEIAAIIEKNPPKELLQGTKDSNVEIDLHEILSQKLWHDEEFFIQYSPPNRKDAIFVRKIVSSLPNYKYIESSFDVANDLRRNRERYEKHGGNLHDRIIYSEDGKLAGSLSSSTEVAVERIVQLASSDATNVAVTIASESQRVGGTPISEVLFRDYANKLTESIDIWEVNAQQDQMKKIWPREVGTLRFVPASDRKVSINHNSPEYRNAIDEIEKLERQVIEVGGNDSEDMPAILSGLRATKRLLSESYEIYVEPAFSFIKANINKVLWFLLDFGVDVVRDVVIDAIKRLFGL